jgi:hypothetical protein
LRHNCCNRCSTPAATRPTWQPCRRAATSRWRSTKRPSRPPFAKWPTRLAGRATLGAQREAQEAQAAAETRRLALADLLLKNGAASALDRLDAERALLAARQAVVQLQLAERQNALLLYRVLGGGALVP